MSGDYVRLTKADTVALWHAVSDMDLMARVMNGDPQFTAEQIEQAKARVREARRALVKVNKLRKAQP